MIMKRGIRFFQLGVCLLLLWGLAGSLRAQSSNTLEIDEIAHNRITQGKRFLEMGNFRLAWDAFEGAIDRPFHQETTLAIYLAGVSAYKGKQTELAEKRFRELTEEYPLSIYQEDARYHLAVIQLMSVSESVQEQAIASLIDLQSDTQSPTLKQDIYDLVQDYAFRQASSSTLERMYDGVLFPNKPLFLVPLCYRLVEAEKVEDAESYYEDFLWMGGQEIASLETLFKEETIQKTKSRDIYKLALVLPLHHTLFDPADFDTLKSIPPNSKVALEFYEGFQAAVKEYEQYGEKKILIRVLDSQRDSTRTADLIYELDVFRPDILLGDIYNQQSQQLSEWAEMQQRTQVIPLSPSESLVKGKKHTFLAHPSVEEHGVQMARFAWDSLQLRRVAVWTDRKTGTELLANAFFYTFQQLGGEVVELVVDSVYNQKTIREIEQLVNQMAREGVGGAYLPMLNSQETCGLILSLIERNMGARIKVMGSPHWWVRYKDIDRSLKDRFGLYFSSSYLLEKNNVAYQEFLRGYLQKFHYPPSEFAIQGYDLGRFLLAALDAYSSSSGLTLSDYLREYPIFRAGHTNFQFEGKQSNQFVNIGQFQTNGIVKVNGGKGLGLGE